MKLYEFSAEKIHAMIAAREVRAEEVLDAALGRIAQVEPKINAFTTLTADAARESARQADSGQAAAFPVPCGIKDNICTRGVRTSCSSKILETFVPPYDATVASKIREAGGIMVGKMNMDEFAMGSSTENSGFFPTHNPWDLSRVPGGSSGGAAAAVAAQEVYYALGSDTGGSIRQPASFCGVVGLKPTYGVVSRYGLVAFASSLDQIGPITRSVSDCAAVLNLIGGHDPLDSTSLPADKIDYRRFLQEDIKGMRIGYPREYFQKGVDDSVKEVVKRALLKYEELGAIVEETSLPHSEYAMPAYYIIATAEASTNLARFEGVRYGYRNAQAEDIVEMMSRSRAEAFGSEVKLRIMLGTYALSSGYYDAYYLKALKVRRLIKEDFDAAFKKYDLLVSPVATSTAFPLGEKCDDPLAMYMSDILTIPVNLAGIPAMSIPGGLVDGLPVGVHLMGPPLSEGALLKAAYAFEQATEHHLNTPNLEV